MDEVKQDELGALRSVLLSTVRAVHMVVLFFFILAWAFPFEIFWKVHLIAAPIMVLQWKLNRDTCILTNIENVILGRGFYGQEAEGQFIRSVIETYLGFEPSDKVLLMITYGILWGAWAICLVRYLW